MKKIILLLVGIIVLALWFYYIDPHMMWEGIKSTHLPYLVIGYIFFFVTHSIKMIRWASILAKVKRVPAGKIFNYYWASLFINTFMPLRVGEVSKSLFLKKDYEIDISSSMSSIVVDRFYGIVVRLIVICLIPLFSIDLYSHLKNYLIYITLACLIICICISLFLINFKFFSKIIEKVLFLLPLHWRHTVLSFLEGSVNSIKKIHLYKRDIVIFGILSVLALLTQALMISFFFKAVGVNLPLSIYIITTTIMDFLVMLPSPPASIGTTEWYTNIVYTIGLGVSKNTVASITLLTHAIGLFIFGLLGGFCLIAVGQGVFSKDTAGIRERTEGKKGLSKVLQPHQ